MYQYPHTIENGHGESLTFLRRIIRDGIEYLEVENHVLPDSGPPMHVHHRQSEQLTIVEGTMAIQLAGQEPRYLHAGETATFTPGQVHRFWNAGNTPLRCTGMVWPADNMEYFLTEIYRSIRESGSGRPKTFDAAYLLHRYRTEFDMQNIPVFVKRVIFPVALFTGRLRGLHKKYKDAPVPVK